MGRICRAVALCAATGWATAANADVASTPAALEGERLIAGPFWVDAVDSSTRTITVRAPDGAQMTVAVSPNVTAFDDLKKGDRVDIDVHQSMVVALRPARGTSAEAIEPPAARLPTPAPTGAVSSAGAGNARRVTVSVQLTSVDPMRGTIQFESAGNEPRTLQVRDQALRRQLHSLKPGDRVTVTYTEPVATSIRPASGE